MKKTLRTVSIVGLFCRVVLVQITTEEGGEGLDVRERERERERDEGRI